MTALITPVLFVTSAVTLWLVPPREPSSSIDAWNRHFRAIRPNPEESYHADRFRAIRGRISNGDGSPVVGAIVRCARVESLVGLAKANGSPIATWTVPIAAEALADSEGRYSFRHLPIGAYTFFYSAPGLAPSINDLILVQDGLGAVLDVTLEQPLRLRVSPALKSRSQPRLRLVPYRWWPDLPEMEIDPTSGRADFAGLGGPLRKGLIVGLEAGAAWRVVGRYDLDESDEAVIGLSPPSSVFDLGEAAGFEAWGAPASPESRAFFAAMSPIALLWSDPAGDAPFGAAMATFLAESRGEGSGSARGFGPQPFLPVLVESRAGIARLGWASDASEFEFPGLPAGSYRVRALDLFGRVTFARGVDVTAGNLSKTSDAAWTKLDLGEPEAREIMGFVRWEGRAPAAKAIVFVQHSGNFRLYLKRVEADENGFFRVMGVPGGEPYFVFAVPPGEATAIREFAYFEVASDRREVWRDLTIHEHRIVGRRVGDDPEVLLQLVRTDSGGDRPVLTFTADPSGRFTIANVPHGRYRVQVSSGEGIARARSLPIEIVEGRSEEHVLWP